MLYMTEDIPTIIITDAEVHTWLHIGWS